MIELSPRIQHSVLQLIVSCIINWHIAKHTFFKCIFDHYFVNLHKFFHTYSISLILLSISHRKKIEL